MVRDDQPPISALRRKRYDLDPVAGIDKLTEFVEAFVRDASRKVAVVDDNYPAAVGRERKGLNPGGAHLADFLVGFVRDISIEVRERHRQRLYQEQTSERVGILPAGSLGGLRATYSKYQERKC